nr:unnamed protein product [Spirometra erinaceieuropaei]
MLFPFLCICYLIAPESRIGNMLHKPFIKFLCQSSAYILFLALLILVAIRIEYVLTDAIEDRMSRRDPPASVIECIVIIFIFAYGLIELTSLDLEYPHVFTEFVGKLIFGAYCCIAFIVLLNMLIAMMNNSYQQIAKSLLMAPVEETDEDAHDYLPSDVEERDTSVIAIDLPVPLELVEVSNGCVLEILRDLSAASHVLKWRGELVH